jgi:plasmid stabilization system protein ParE
LSQYRLSNQAMFDLDDIWSHLAESSVNAANHVLDQIYEALLKLSRMPQMGHLREDLVDEPLRFWSVYSYLIVYRPETDPIEIVRVVSGHQDLTQLLRQPQPSS